MREPSDDYLSAFNCLLCYYALGDRDRMRSGFVRMLQMKLPVGDEDRYLNLQDDPQVRLGRARWGWERPASRVVSDKRPPFFA